MNKKKCALNVRDKSQSIAGLSLDLLFLKKLNDLITQIAQVIAASKLHSEAGHYT